MDIFQANFFLDTTMGKRKTVSFTHVFILIFNIQLYLVCTHSTIKSKLTETRVANLEGWGGVYENPVECHDGDFSFKHVFTEWADVDRGESSRFTGGRPWNKQKKPILINYNVTWMILQRWPKIWWFCYQNHVKIKWQITDVVSRVWGRLIKCTRLKLSLILKHLRKTDGNFQMNLVDD